MDVNLLNFLKHEFGEIYIIHIGDKEFAYRALTIEEIENFENLKESSVDLEDLYVQNAIVYPQDFDINKIKAGHVSTLAEAIGGVSGTNINFILNTLDAARRKGEEDILVKIKAMILAAMPVYSEEYLLTLTMKQLLEKLVLSEEILTINQIVNGIESTNGVRLELVPVDEQEVAKPKAKPKIDKETLLKRIASEERKTVNQSISQVSEIEALAQLDEEILTKALGFADAEDPIARKLRQAMGG